MGRRPRRLEKAEITFTARVRAKQLRFARVPHTATEFSGTPAHDSDSGSDRVNLPERVEKDVNYRHVQVDYWFASALLDPGQAIDLMPGLGAASE